MGPESDLKQFESSAPCAVSRHLQLNQMGSRPRQVLNTLFLLKHYVKCRGWLKWQNFYVAKNNDDFADSKSSKKKRRESSFLNSNEKKTDRKRNRLFLWKRKLYFRQKLTTNWSRHSATRTFRHAGAFYYNLAHIDKNEQKKFQKYLNLIFFKCPLNIK